MRIYGVSLRLSSSHSIWVMPESCTVFGREPILNWFRSSLTATYKPGNSWASLGKVIASDLIDCNCQASWYIQMSIWRRRSLCICKGVSLRRYQTSCQPFNRAKSNLNFLLVLPFFGIQFSDSGLKPGKLLIQTFIRCINVTDFSLL